MDDETAEIELLEQNLRKTRQISQRMTSILSSFDTRLIKVEKSILPLYNASQMLGRRGKNIESAVQKIDEIKSNQEGIAAEEALILRGPQPGRIDEYKDVVERVNAGLVFGSLERETRDTARLVETGAKKLTQMYTKLVAEASSGTPINGTEFQLTSFPPAQMSALGPLVEFLRTLPLPATHPSHPAAAAIQASLKEAQKGYADMRGAWAKKCLELYGRRVVERSETLDGVKAGREFGVWVDNLLVVAEEEYNLLVELAPLATAGEMETTFAALISPLIDLFTSTLGSISALIKKSINKHTFLALSSHANLSLCQGKWDDFMCRRAGRTENELKDGLHSIRASCLRSFPELIADIRLAANGKGGELSTGLHDITISTIKYLERIPEVQSAATSALYTLGDGNWRMGDGVQIGKAPVKGDSDENAVLEHFMFDVVNAVIGTLQTLSRTGKRPSFGSIFLINNISYLRTRLLVKPQADILPLLSKPTQDIINSNFRTAKAAYFDSNLSPLMQTLQEEKDKGKAAIKEKFTRFFDVLEEVSERHKLARVLQDDREGREQMADEVVKMVVPSLQRFQQKYGGKDFSRNPQKYIKMSSDEVENHIRGFYAESDGKVVPVAERVENNRLIQAGWSR
ncbi:Cullin repeat-like-containing domain protein [Cristinia sonorae]|uniref:Exocyst complex protein EXO70 n=1 Tax=Cristinia sonorae TaxID=1940300 RepID=A0A8K0UGQ0_9AGAR|nr:Cullin repeat-like-containing domain protein [Cristinia sonorae]